MEFQSTPPRGGRLLYSSGDPDLWVISIHAPARGATTPTSGNDWSRRFQSTPPRGGRLDVLASWKAEIDFNPRPREGGDMMAARHGRHFSNFNPRPREGGDAETLPISSTGAISIHAPARGATLPPFLAGCLDGFQSTPPRGGRLFHYLQKLHPCNFNPRPREGGDLPWRWSKLWLHLFQSTPPRGGRLC